jgi:hypothetical protein
VTSQTLRPSAPGPCINSMTIALREVVPSLSLIGYPALRGLYGTCGAAQRARHSAFINCQQADLNNITEENSGGQTVAMHAASEGLKAGAESTAFLYALRARTGVPMTLASKWLGRLSVALIAADAVTCPSFRSRKNTNFQLLHLRFEPGRGSARDGARVAHPLRFLQRVGIPET